MAEKMTTKEIVEADWNPWTTGLDGKWSFETLKSAAALHAARNSGVMVDRLTRCMLALEGIVSRLDTLGREGLHDIVKELAREARAKKQRRLARRRAARRLKLVGAGDAA